MLYGIPGSPEGHIDGVDIDLNKNVKNFISIKKYP